MFYEERIQEPITHISSLSEFQKYKIQHLGHCKSQQRFIQEATLTGRKCIHDTANTANILKAPATRSNAII